MYGDILRSFQGRQVSLLTKRKPEIKKILKEHLFGREEGEL
jgi:hypothetical protein